MTFSEEKCNLSHAVALYDAVIGGSSLEKNCYGHDTLRFNFLIKYSVLFDQSLEISIERTGGRIFFPLSRRLT